MSDLYERLTALAEIVSRDDWLPETASGDCIEAVNRLRLQDDEIERLRAALAVYADRGNWEITDRIKLSYWYWSGAKWISVCAWKDGRGWESAEKALKGEGE